MTSDLFLAILAMDAYNRAGDGKVQQGLIVASVACMSAGEMRDR
jgi:hypothetical protein